MNNTVKNIPIFPKDARVCFVGDSLTACAFWVDYVFEYYLEKFPKSQLRVYNAGIGSGTIDFSMSYIEENIMIWNPTHVVIMFGANDMLHIHGTYEERALAYENKLRWMTDEFIKRGITVYFSTEPAYKEPIRNADDMTIVRDVTYKLAQEYDTGVCDFYTTFTPFMENYREIVMDADNLHFSMVGQAVIARLFLASQGFDIDVNNTEEMLKRIELTYFGDRKNIFDRKLRCTWFAEALILTAVIGQPLEKKLERLYGRIPTRANGAWGDLEFYRAMDYIEMRPNMDIYIKQVDAAIDLMLEEAAKNA